MWGTNSSPNNNNKPVAPRGASNTVDTLIGRQTEIRGDVVFSGGLHVDGVIRGKVTAHEEDKSAMLSISESGLIEGDVHVPHMMVNGRIQGDVHAMERVSMAQKAHVVGNVHYKLLEMASGAMVNGQLFHHSEESLAAITHERA